MGLRYVRDASNQGQIVPWWFGWAYDDLRRRQTVFFPLGMNLVVQFGRWAYCSLRRRREGWFDVKIRESYEAGRMEELELLKREWVDVRNYAKENYERRNALESQSSKIFDQGYAQGQADAAKALRKPNLN